MIRKNLLLIGLVLFVFGALVASCTQEGSGAAPAPTTPAAAPPAGTADGQAVFQKNCDACHPGGGAGVGPSVKNTGLTDDQLETQIRQGKGQMPAFNQQAISDAEMQALIQYMGTLN